MTVQGAIRTAVEAKEEGSAYEAVAAVFEALHEDRPDVATALALVAAVTSLQNMAADLDTIKKLLRES